MSDDRVLAALSNLRDLEHAAEPDMVDRVRAGGRRRLRRRRATRAGVVCAAVAVAGGVPVGLAFHGAGRETLQSAPSTGGPEGILGLYGGPAAPSAAIPTSAIDDSGGRTPTITRTACVTSADGTLVVLGRGLQSCPAGTVERPLIVASQTPYTPPPLLPDTCVGEHHDLRLKWSDAKDFGFFPLAGAAVPTDAAGVLARTNDLPNVVDNAVTEAMHLTDEAVSAYWYAYGPVADGREVVVSESAVGNGPCHVYAVLRRADTNAASQVVTGSVAQHTSPPAALTQPTAARAVETPQVVDGGLTRSASPLPVRVHLPSGLGWVVAAKGSALAWARAGSSTFTPVGVNAALLPDDAVNVQVTPRGGHSSVVALG